MKVKVIAFFMVLWGFELSAQPNVIFLGGKGQGYAVQLLKSSLTSIYQGGDGQGYNLNDFLNLQLNYYNGGKGVGYSFNKTNPSEFIFGKGGADDGYAMHFLYADFIWTGNQNEFWNNSENWNTNFLPDVSRKVIIPAGVENFPLIIEEYFAIGQNPDKYKITCQELIIQAKAQLITGSKTQIINAGQISIEGTLKFQNPLDHSFLNNGNIMITKNGELAIKTN